MSEMYWTLIIGVISIICGIALNLAFKSRIIREPQK
jgi:hypothetical protein